MKSVIIDLDGVLADFTKGYRTLANQFFNKEKFDTLTRPHGEWNDPDISPDEDAKIWEYVGKPENRFWEKLDALINHKTFYRLDVLAEKNNVYFITNRVAANAKQQSEEWLMSHGLSCPTVILAKTKGGFAKHLNASYAIDDRWENVWDMAHHCWSYAMTRPHNKKYEWPLRVDTFSEWLDIVEKEEKPDIQRVSGKVS